MANRRNEVLQGDCLNLFQSLESGQVDLVFADPPFNIGYAYDVYDDRKNADDYTDWCRQWIKEVRRVLKPSGSFWLAIGDEYAAELKLVAQNDAGFTCRSWVIWYYTFGVNCVRGFSRSHTHLFHFVADPKDFTFNGDNPATRVPSARQLVYADLRANPKGRLPDNTWIFRPQDAPEGSFAPAHDTWFFSRVAGTFKEREGFHGCQMPEQLLGRILRVSSNPRDLVLDPFSGSGTTLVVAKKLGRQWLGFELSESYVARIQSRLDGAQVGDLLDGPEDPMRSAPKTSQGKIRKGPRFKRGSTAEVDEEMRYDIVQIFETELRGESADVTLCDPELNAVFIDACKKKNLEGTPALWNRTLLQARKAGRFSTAAVRAPRLRAGEMDLFSFASEIAMRTFTVEYLLSIDELLCDPLYAKEFDRVAADFAPGYSPFEYRWGAMSLRKRAKQSRIIAEEHFSAWQPSDLPPLIELAEFGEMAANQSGVYLLRDFEETLIYVGETTNIDHRIANALRDPSPWRDLNVRWVQFVSVDPALQLGLQARVVTAIPSRLNSELLRTTDPMASDEDATIPTAAPSPGN